MAVDKVGYRYKGIFKDGSLVKGKWFYPSGALWYEGEWSGGQWHGMGTRFDANGDVYTGRHEQGRLFDGTLTRLDGTVRKRVNGEWL